MLVVGPADRAQVLIGNLNIMGIRESNAVCVLPHLAITATYQVAEADTLDRAEAFYLVEQGET